MADTQTLIVEGNPTAPEAKTTRTRSNVNTQQLKQLEVAEQIALAAQRAPYAAKLASHDVTASGVAALLTTIGQGRDQIGNAIQHTADRATATREEASSQKQLTTQLRQVQAAANQKYARDPHLRPQLRSYWIGSGLAVNQPTLSEASHAILERLQTDTLPGITSEFIAGMRQTRQAWQSATQRQFDAQASAIQARESAGRLLKTITDERLKIQFAVDAAYPVGAEGSDAVRAEFGIPKTRPFRAR